MRAPKAFRLRAIVASLCFAFVCGGATSASAALILGSAENFAVLAASTVTNTLATTIQGDVGLYPGSSVTGGGLITLLGGSVLEVTSPAAHGGESAAMTAYNSLVALTPTTDLTGKVLGSGGTVGTLTPGVYSFSSSAQLTGTLTLDFGSHPNTPFVFQIGSTLTTASASAIDVINGDASSAIYWQVGSSATLGTTTVMAGNILAAASITLNTGADILCGRAIALTGAVTLQGNTISNDCGSYNGGTGRSDFGSVGFSGVGNTTTVPEPASVLFLASGLLGFAALRRSGLRANRP